MGNSEQKQAGFLTVIYSSVPADITQASANGLSGQEIDALIAVRLFRKLAYDWGFTGYNAVQAALSAPEESRSYVLFKPNGPGVVPLKSGDLVRVFKSVSDGDVHWSGQIDYSHGRYDDGLQKDVSPRDWQRMFRHRLPARLEREGRVIFGCLDPFGGQGTEGTIWSVHEFDKPGYDGVQCLERGDHLTVYGAVRDGDVEWEGALDFGGEDTIHVGESKAHVIRTAQHIDTATWLEWSWQSRPVIVTPK